MNELTENLETEFGSFKKHFVMTQMSVTFISSLQASVNELTENLETEFGSFKKHFVMIQSLIQLLSSLTTLTDVCNV